ncbi:hypothetical protein F511_20688 [Dorcoceras hygrometricum]|uniref:Uncharacterized protein n=1 Tax=Dorcoceras hygrometricum TaxID=472368 RepID=A0A2Z7CS71_9LAMI|nr:hypothetical protein F511_20688 [Dorcoceras hygrometricum]
MTDTCCTHAKRHIHMKVYPSASSSPINLSAMASALINNTIQVYFASVQGMEHEGMVSMFEALLASDLSGFLECSSAIYEAVWWSSSEMIQSRMVWLSGLVLISQD